MLYYLSAKNIFKVSFCESGKGQSHTLMSNDEHDKRQWVNAIRNAINAVKKTSTSSLKPLPLPLRQSTSTSSTSSEEDIWQTGCDNKTSMLPTFEWPCFPWKVWELNSFKNKGHTLSHNLFELKVTHVSVETLSTWRQNTEMCYIGCVQVGQGTFILTDLTGRRFLKDL